MTMRSSWGTQSYYNWGAMAEAGAETDGILRLPESAPHLFSSPAPLWLCMQGETRVRMAMVAVCTYARHSGALPTAAVTQVTSLLQTARPVKVGCFTNPQHP